MALTIKDSLFRDIPHPVWIVEKGSLRFLDVNEAATTIYGYSREEFLRITLHEIRNSEGFENHQEGGSTPVQIWEHKAKDGQIIFVEIYTFPADINSDDKSLAMILDVTGRVKMQRERAELLERYQILSEAAHDLLWDWDLRTNKITHNEALVTLYGYDRSHLQEDINWWADLIHPEDYAIASWSIQEAIREKRRFWSAEYRFKKADGSYIPVLDRGILQTDENEEPVRMIGSIVDLTTRKAVEDERNQLFRLSLDSMLMLDPSGTITQSNAAFHSLAGQEVTDKKRQNMRDFLSKVDTPAFDSAVGKALLDGIDGHFLTSISTQAGRGKTVQWGLITNEARNRLFLIGRDITEEIVARQKLEEALVRSQELAIEAQAATKAQTEFLQNMSHELRTPMNGLLGTAQLIAASASTEKQIQFASILIQSGESLLQILNDILDFSKIESGEIHLDKTPFYLPEIIQTAFNLFVLPAQQKNLTLTSSVSSDAEMMVEGDPFRMRQILNNLIGNAIKFTESGEIHLTMEVGPHSEGKIEAIIKVVDTGIGIELSMQDLIFQRFIQVDSSLTRRHGGTGLGLSITRTLVELMGGRISVVSRVGFGSEFTVRIPFDISAQTKLPKPLKSVHPVCIRSGTRVLIAEDVEVNAIILTSWLEDRGFECVIASTGREAIAMLRADSFDGVFLDLHMPDFSGYDVVHLIRDLEHNSKTRLPVVAVTASVSNEERQKCLSSGFDDYIPKPVMVDDLDRVITRLFDMKA